MPEKTQQSKRRNWCFTCFTPRTNWGKIYKENTDKIRYLCVGIEVCPKTKKQHYQGWVQMKNAIRMSTLKNLFNDKTIHCEPCKGNEEQNDKYCQKEKNFKTWGEFQKQGQRNDLKAIYDRIQKGELTEEQLMAEDFRIYCMYRNGFKDAFALALKNKSSQFRHVEVEYCYGETGTGKTRYAMENQDVYKIQGSDLQWFDGYNGQQTLVIDEYANDVKITQLLALLDGYQLRLNVKGGFSWAAWTKVILTSNLSPELLHSNANQLHRSALFRRITKISHVSQSGRVILARPHIGESVALSLSNEYTN